MRAGSLTFVVAALALGLFLAACGGSGSGAAPSPTHGDGVTAAPATANASPASPTAGPASTPTALPRETAVVLKPTIEDALSCRVPARGPSGQAGTSTPGLQRHDIDIALFPRAICNDGSPAVLFFRPYEGEVNRNRWVIGLAGGGSCATPQDCANRWCGVDTNFDSSNMSTDAAGNANPGDGIFARRPENPFANWNQVFVRYCSSDLWSGRAPALTVQANDPATGKPVEYMIAMTGSFVLDAALATLNRDPGTAPLTYVRTRAPLPDLSDAAEVVFAGGSAGGVGVVFNLDRVAALLAAGPNRPIVRGLIDSATTPDLSKLGWGATEACRTNGRCTYETAVSARDTQALNRHLDESCVEWHARNRPGTEWLCTDVEHVMANHLTTPYFVRMGLTDRLISSEIIAAGYTLAGRPLTLLTFASELRQFLLDLPAAVAKGEERQLVTTPPGVYAPTCPEHYTIYANETVYGVAIPGGGRQVTFFDVWKNWVGGTMPSVVASSDPRTDTCR